MNLFSHTIIVTRALGLVFALVAVAQAGPGDWSGQGPFGGNIVTVQADPLVPTRVYAFTTNGFFRSDDAGSSWTLAENGLLSPHPTNGIFTVSASVSGKVWLFDDLGRLYSSSDAGANWFPTGYTAATLATPADSSFVPFLLYSLAAGTGSQLWFADNTSGLLVSSDNGATFGVANAGILPGVAVPVVATNPSNPQDVIAGTASGCDAASGACSIHVSSDGGAGWTQIDDPDGITSAGEARRLVQIAFGPGATVYANYDDQNGGVYSVMRSADSGMHWTAHPGCCGALAASPSDANTVWLGASKSIDGGASFTPLPTTGRTTNGVLVPGTAAIAISPDYATTHRLWIGSTSAGMYLSNDDGATWVSSNDGLAATDIRTVVVHPNDNTRIYAGFGDSLSDPSPAFYRSTSTGTWTISNSGLNAYQLRTILIDPTTAGTVGSTVIYAVGSGFDSSPPDNRAYNSGIYKSLDGGLTWATQSGGIPVRGTGH